MNLNDKQLTYIWRDLGPKTTPQLGQSNYIPIVLSFNECGSVELNFFFIDDTFFSIEFPIFLIINYYSFL